MASWHGNAFCIAGPFQLESFDILFVARLNTLLNQRTRDMYCSINCRVSSLHLRQSCDEPSACDVTLDNRVPNNLKTQQCFIVRNSWNVLSVCGVHDDIISREPCPRHRPFVRGIHHKGTFIESLIVSLSWDCASCWTNFQPAGDFRH